jgi:hypothetical protein
MSPQTDFLPSFKAAAPGTGERIIGTGRYVMVLPEWLVHTLVLGTIATIAALIATGVF